LFHFNRVTATGAGLIVHSFSDISSRFNRVVPAEY